MHNPIPKLLLYLAFFLYLSPAAAQIVFDSSFHNDGWTTFIYSSNTKAYSHTVLSDGNILAAGNQPASYYSGYLFRFQPDGSNSGNVMVNNCMDKMVIHRMPGDTLIVAGQGWDNTFNHQPGNQMITITKRAPNGQPVASFANGGTVSFYVPLGMSNAGGHPSAITMQPDGKIVLSITVTTIFAYSMVIRLLPNGQFDNTFGQGGVKEIILGSCGYIINRIFPLAGGKLLFTGDYMGAGSTQHYSAFRLQPNGNYDSSYGTNGYVYIIPGLSGKVNGSAVEPDGKVVLVGSIGGGFNLYAAAVRFTANGVPDNSFGTNGFVHSANNFRYAVAVERDSQGRFCVLGTYTPNNGQSWNWYLTRLKADGTSDSTFNSNALFPFSLPSGVNEIRGLSLLPNGKILVYGDYRDANYQWNLYLGRLLTKPWVAVGGGGTDYCAGDTATLMYYGNGQPHWYQNGVVMPDTGRTILVATGSTYHAVSQSSNDSSDPVILNFHPLPQPVIQISGDSLVVTGGGNFSWYNAIDSTVIPGASGASFHPADSGSFYVRQTDSNGCVGYSAVVQFTPVGIEVNATATGAVACWPNPSAGALHIRNDSRNTYELQISLVTGQVIALYQVGPGLQVIDLKQWGLPANSLLILQFSGERERINRKVLVL
jgi:uncharacterized delta-60 repeat protein